MLKAGLTGGYASGKSLVAKHLESLGCFVVYADQLGHQVLAPTGEAYHPTLSLFGNEILNPDLSINRKKLASIVFQTPQLLDKLNAIVHPAVFRSEENALIGFESQNPHGLAVIEAALLIETGRYKHLDRLLVTSCDPETQIARAIERDRITREAALARIARQLPDADRVRFANYVIYTGGTPAETIAQTDCIHAELRQLAEAPSPCDHEL
jgi:dephospho-CoA kinase